MDSFPWADCFVTGLSSVDEQHRKLVDLINRFGELVVQPRATRDEDIESVYVELAAYAGRHFAEEEELMQRAGLDPRCCEAHRAEHLRFLHEVERLRAGMAHAGGARARNESARRLLRFMINWLAYHILGSDQAMAAQIAAVDAGAPPAQAWETVHKARDPATATLLLALDGLFQQMSERNRELSELNHSLEARVAERTRELSEANRRLEETALTDALTGLVNRRGALQQLQLGWRDGDGDSDHRPLACIMLDADGFKSVNDTHGHDAGDAVLQQVAWQIKTVVRNDDTVCRLGGDEFLVVCRHTPLAGALQLAEQIRLGVAAMRVPVGNGDFWPGSASLGVAVRTPAMGSVEDLLKAADQGLYLAKRRGRNAVGCVAAQQGAAEAAP